MTLPLPVYLDTVQTEGLALLAAARQAPDVVVPSCPKWHMADLLGHVGRIHRWVAGMLSTHATVRGEFPSAPDGGDALVPWYREGLARVVEALLAVDPDEPVWNWVDDAPAPARFWPRRMAHETAVHRWDAEQAAGGAPSALDPALAADGIDETLGFVNVWLRRRPAEGLSGHLAIAPTDAATSWALALRPERVERLEGAGGHDTGRPDAGPPDAAVVGGTSSDLLLWLLGRCPTDRLEVVGDPEVPARWARSIVFP